jgi:short-subunit dehydrogenase
MVSFDGKRVLVTGASSGIGAGLAEDFARKGATVGICARRSDRLEEVLERCRAHGSDCRMWVTELSDPLAVDTLAASASTEMGGIDILVNNAGMPKRRHITQLDVDTVESVMRLNYLSPVQLTLCLLPAMLDRSAGTIINISSVAATLSSPGESAYDASKAALSAFSEAMAIDLWGRGVKVLVVDPGLVATELFDTPGNDPVIEAGVEPVTVDHLVTAVFDALEREAVQVYVPDWFEDIAATKARDVQAFLSGAAEFVSERSRGD